MTYRQFLFPAITNQKRFSRRKKRWAIDSTVLLRKKLVEYKKCSIILSKDSYCSSHSTLRCLQFLFFTRTKYEQAVQMANTRWHPMQLVSHPLAHFAHPLSFMRGKEKIFPLFGLDYQVGHVTHHQIHHFNQMSPCAVAANINTPDF